jgi:thiosulfate/3-mercaptopyruvate sulfurtransferase
MLANLRCIYSTFFLALLLLAACSEQGENEVPGILVSTDWLEEHLNAPDLVILHSGTAELYDSIHIPGARLTIPARFTETTAEMRNQIPSADSLVAMLRKLGVNNDSRIVLYAQSASLMARTARIFVTLDHLGLGDRVHVLNGGLQAWQEEERKLTHLVPDIKPGNLTMSGLKEVAIESAELSEVRWSADFVLIDSRSDEEYYGRPASEDKSAEGGHIEGAYFLSYRDLLMDESPHLFKPDSELEDLFHKMGMDRDKKTVVYCGSGIRASVSYLAARHLGYPVWLYDGSYEEWSSLDLPLTGPVPQPGTNE